MKKIILSLFVLITLIIGLSFTNCSKSPISSDKNQFSDTDQSEAFELLKQIPDIKPLTPFTQGALASLHKVSHEGSYDGTSCLGIKGYIYFSKMETAGTCISGGLGGGWGNSIPWMRVSGHKSDGTNFKIKVYTEYTDGTINMVQHLSDYELDTGKWYNFEMYRTGDKEYHVYYNDGSGWHLVKKWENIGFDWLSNANGFSEVHDAEDNGWEIETYNWGMQSYTYENNVWGWKNFDSRNSINDDSSLDIYYYSDTYWKVWGSN
jgi:hypothetical protein